MSEIAALRLAEARMETESREGDRLVRALLRHYACDFVIAHAPDGYWFKLPQFWQAGLSEPLRPNGLPVPKKLRGAVGLSIGTLRRIAAEQKVVA